MTEDHPYKSIFDLLGVKSIEEMEAQRAHAERWGGYRFNTVELTRRIKPFPFADFAENQKFKLTPEQIRHSQVEADRLTQKLCRMAKASLHHAGISEALLSVRFQFYAGMWDGPSIEIFAATTNHRGYDAEERKRYQQEQVKRGEHWSEIVTVYPFGFAVDGEKLGYYYPDISDRVNKVYTEKVGTPMNAPPILYAITVQASGGNDLNAIDQLG